MELQYGRCPPRLLHRIAVAYHDFSHDREEATPRRRVLKLLRGHQDLADAVIEGFRRVVGREDLPTPQEVIRLNERKLRSHYALPILAGLDADLDLVTTLRPAEIARAAAFYYLTPLNVPGHPTRCTGPQISALRTVLLAALRWRVDGLEGFVDQRAAKRDLDVSQRALWLAAGLLLALGRYVPEVTAFLEDGGEARSRELVRLLAPAETDRLPMPWGTAGLATMIRLLGSRYSPWTPEGFGMAGYVEEDRMRVEALISSCATTLAWRTNRAATEALHSLVDDPALEAWHLMLGEKRDEQVLARRDATFAVSEPDSVQETLANEGPGGPADLAAVVAEGLERLGRDIRDGGADDWRQYWREDERGRLLGPRREESCRDALLSDLRRLLPDGVDAQREAVYTRGNRSDIRVDGPGDWQRPW